MPTFPSISKAYYRWVFKFFNYLAYGLFCLFSGTIASRKALMCYFSLLLVLADRYKCSYQSHEHTIVQILEFHLSIISWSKRIIFGFKAKFKFIAQLKLSLIMFMSFLEQETQKYILYYPFDCKNLFFSLGLGKMVVYVRKFNFCYRMK